MTKTELQSALAEATPTDKRTAGVFLDTLSALAYKEIKKKGEFVLPGFGKLVKQKRKARTGFNPKTQQKIKIPAQNRRQISCCQGCKGRGSGGKEVVQQVPLRGTTNVFPHGLSYVPRAGACRSLVPEK